MLSVQGISKAFVTTPILHQVSFSVDADTVLAVLGRSGCGKTTLLKIIAGLEQPDSGDIRVHGQSVLATPPNERQIVYLYQEPLLFPHLTVFENVAFGLRIRKHRNEAIRQEVEAMLDALELADQARKAPHQLSGGQRQRVAFGRALIIRPQLLLLDEPFGNLDAQTRATMQVLFRQVSRQYGITSLFVTHDSREALTVGTAFSYLDKGEITTYPSVGEFIADPRTGIREELDFWETIQADAINKR